MEGTVVNYTFQGPTSMYGVRVPSATIPMIEKAKTDLFNLIAYRFIDDPVEVSRFINRVLMFYNIDYLIWAPKTSVASRSGVKTELALDTQSFMNEFNSKGANEICTDLLNTKVHGAVNELIPIIQSSLILSIKKCLKIVISDPDFSESDQKLAKELYDALKRAINIKYGSDEALKGE